MRILQVMARMNVGGTARYLDTLVSGLGGLGHEVTLATGYVQGDEAEDGSVGELPIVRIEHMGRALDPRVDMVARRELAQVVRAFKPDVIHSHTFKAGLLARTVAGDVTHVHTFHGSSLNDPEFRGTGACVMLGLERMLAHRAQSLVTVSGAIRDEMLSARIGRPEQYRIIHPGVAPLIPIARAQARTELGLDEDALVVAWLARFAPVKGPERVLELALALPELTFLMAGGGPLLHEIAARAPGNVRVLGWSDPRVVYGAADIALLTSHSEGFGIGLVEASTVGLPVVTTDAGGVAEAVVDGVTGRVVPMAAMADALRALAGDAALRATMGKAGRTWAADTHTPAAMVDKHVALYAGLLRR